MEPLFDVKGLGSKETILLSDGIEDKERSRRIKIYFELGDEKIVKKLKGLFND